MTSRQISSDHATEVATLAGGCFWCLEAIFAQLQGVISVRSGYCGGETVDPTYAQVCAGATGHAEAVEVLFDPDQISYRNLLEVFFAIHDPTTLNRQGNDVGTQYRSAIFTHSAEQKRLAVETLAALESSGAFAAPVVTEVQAATTFYPAEDDHQRYYAEHPAQPYCRAVIAPKLAKFRQTFAPKLK